MAAASSVPVGFHYETKYVVLSYLGYTSQEGPGGDPSTSSGPGALRPPDPETLEKVKADVEDALRSLEEEIAADFPRTGFDALTSAVFSPSNPETSVEETLSPLVERMCQLMGPPLHSASSALLSADVTYDAFKREAETAAAHTTGWNKVLVPLFLLRRLLLEQTRRGDAHLEQLVGFGVSYIVEESADYIIKQGGWGALFSLGIEEEEGLIAEDSNDIYILTSDTSEQVTPPESLAVSSSWQAESLPTSLGPESWQQVAMDPEELKSLDSGGGEERSDNNSSNSDIVHVEKEEIAEVMEEAAVVERREAESAEEERREAEEESAEEEAEERELLLLPAAAAPVALSSTLPPATEGEKSPEEPSEEVPEPLTPPEESEEDAQVTSPAPPPAVPQPTRTEEDKPVFLPEGKSILLYGGAAAVAVLALAVGLVIAIRKK